MTNSHRWLIGAAGFALGLWTYTRLRPLLQPDKPYDAAAVRTAWLRERRQR